MLAPELVDSVVLEELSRLSGAEWVKVHTDNLHMWGEETIAAFQRKDRPDICILYRIEKDPESPWDQIRHWVVENGDVFLGHYKHLIDIQFDRAVVHFLTTGDQVRLWAQPKPLGLPWPFSWLARLFSPAC